MFKIQIKEGLKYSSRKKGAFCFHPPFSLQIYPCRLELKDLETSKSWIFLFKPKSAFRDFSFVHDLKRLKTDIFAKNREGLFHYSLSSKGLFFHNVNSIELESEVFTGALEKKQCIALPAQFNYKPSTELEQLFLGSHKLSRLQTLQERLDLKQILPFCLYLEQILKNNEALSMNNIGEVKGKAVFALLENLETLLENKEHDQLTHCLQELYLASFKDLFVPRLVDDEWQGFTLSAAPQDLNPLLWFSELAKRLRSLFFKAEGLRILPHLPPQLHCGSYLALQSEEISRLDFEWTKKQIRRLYFVPKRDCELLFHFQRDIRSFRLRSLDFEKKRIKCGEILACQKGKGYFLDNFQK